MGAGPVNAPGPGSEGRSGLVRDNRFPFKNNNPFSVSDFPQFCFISR